VVEGRPIDTIVDQSRTLLRALEFSGISEVEFKVHADTGVPYLIEVNPRHWDQHHLGTVCGVNLSLELYRDVAEPRRLASSEHDDPPPRQDAGPVRWIAEHDLFHHLLQAVLRRDGSWRPALACARGRRTYSVFDRRDPSPGLRQLRNTAGELRRMAANRLRASTVRDRPVPGTRRT
jgi:predicted ATP-grasp superfamily ATP-dependent carboligase